MLVMMTTDTVGGVWTYSLQLAGALARRGAQVHLATMGPAMRPDQRRELAASGVAAVHESTFALEWMPAPWAEVDEAGRWLLELGGRLRPDVVHLNGYAHASLPWGVPTVVAAHSCVLSWWEAVHRRPAPPEWCQYACRVRTGLLAAGVVVAPSAAMSRALGECYGYHDCVVVPNGRDAGWLPAPAAPAKERFVLASGRAWDRAKNLSLINEIAPRLSWPVLVAGPVGPPGSAGQSPVARRPAAGRGAAGHVQAAQLGALPFGELAGWLARASVFAAPSLYEPFGLGVLEAAQAGCALVLSDIDSFREIWARAAVYVPARNPSAWVATLEHLCSEPRLVAEMGEAARERARRYTPEAMAEAYLGIYGALITARAGGAGHCQPRPEPAGPVPARPVPAGTAPAGKVTAGTAPAGKLTVPLGTKGPR